MKTTGYNTKHYGFPTKHYCRTLELRDNPELIKEYRRRHQQGNVWQEIIDGIKQVGILEMEIFLLGTRLVMIVEAPAELDLDGYRRCHDKPNGRNICQSFKTLQPTPPPMRNGR